MKKISIAVIALTVALVGAASANAAFTRNLSVGSTGTDVAELQTLLISKGYAIPAISAGVAKGYFGSQTATALKGLQAEIGVPNTGFFGPLTMAKLATLGTTGGTALMTLPFTCPTGYTAPTGWVCPGTANTGGNTGNTGGTLDNTDGSISVSQSSYVSTGASLKKGETKDVVAVKLQATAGAVKVTRVDAHFSIRPWLVFSQAVLKDSSGRVLATKSLSSSADVTEITVGSDYLVRFDGLNYVVSPGTNPDLAVGVTVLAATDKATGQTVYVGMPNNSIRTINGLGFTDSVGSANAFTGSSNPGGAGHSSFTLASTGSVADISTRVGGSAVQVSQVVSATVSTNNVELGVFGLKSANNSATVQSLAVNIATNPNFSKTGLFSNVRLMDGSTSYGALTFTDLGVATFTNLNLSLSQDVWKDLKVVADIAATSTNVLASSTLDASTINATDSTYTQATVGGVAYITATNDQTSANTLLTINSMSLGATSRSIGTGIVDAANGPVQRYPVTYTFTLTNNSSNSLYVSSDVSTLLGTTTSPTNASSTITGYFPTPTPVAGDVAGAYIIPSSGGSRTFTVVGTIKKSSNSSASESLSISRITYGTTSAGTGSTITTGLENLSVLASF